MKKYFLESKSKITEFIAELIMDFSESIHEEILAAEKPATILTSIELLTNQQTIISWINYLVENSITPLLIFSMKEPKKIEDIKQTIIRILLAITQDSVDGKEALNQMKTILTNTYQISEHLQLFIQSLIKTYAQFKKRHGLTELARIGEQTLKENLPIKGSHYSSVTQAVKESIVDREKIMVEWKKNTLYPSCIGLRIAGEQRYNNFITTCQKNFELFLDQTLSADDFEKRVDADLRSFGGDDEELIEPIRDSIASSVKFLEIARIDDPSLSVLLMIIEEEREMARRNCI